jgi:MFS family permease
VRLSDRGLSLGALGERSLRRLLLAQLTSVTGDYIVIAALPFAVFAMGGTTFQVGAAFGTAALLEVGLVLFGGVAGDRFSRRAVMIVADLLRVGSQGFLAILLILGVAQYWQLLAIQVIHGVGSAFFQPAMSGLVPEVVSRPRRQDANALLEITLAVAAIVGPAIAGIAIALAGAGWAFALDAATFGISAICLAGIHVRPDDATEPDDDSDDGSVIADLAEGWGEFRRRTWLWVVVLEFAVLNALVFAPFYVLGAAIAEESLGGPGAWAIILTAAGLGQVAGGVLALLWRPRRPLLIGTLLLASWVAPLLLLAYGASVPTIAGAAAIASGALALFGTVWRTTVQSQVPDRQLSRVSSYDWLGSLAVLPLGFAVAGFAQHVVGAEATLLAAASIVVVATLIVVRLPSIRGLRSVEPPRSAALATASLEPEAVG